MGVMRRNLLLGLALLVMTASTTMAAVTIEESTDAEYLINSGFSQALAEDVFMQKNRIAGKPIEPLYDRNQNKFVRFCKRFYAYLDPAQDNFEERLHHDINLSPSATDL